MGYSPRGHKEPDTTERLTLSRFSPQALPSQRDKDVFPKPAGLSVLVRKSSSTH